MTTCDRCGKDRDLKPFPFKYMMRGAYIQFHGCDQCLWEEEHHVNLPRLTQWKGVRLGN